MSQRVLLISYFFPPYKGVAALRSEYWFRNIPRVSSDKFQVTVVTTTEQVEITPNLQVLKPWGKIPGDQGVGWLIPLFSFLKQNQSQYDIILFTGGPFLHFLLVPWIKLILKKKIILDYRDPFAINPVFEDVKVKKYFKKKLELLFNSYADALVTVNAYCANLIQKPSSKITYIIDNGYDESQESRLPVDFEKTKKMLLLAGSFSFGRSTESLLKVVDDSAGLSVVHVGLTSLRTNSPKYFYRGAKTYSETLGYIEISDICLIFTSGHPYESTTKIFDYLRMNKKILIISDVIPTEGSLLSLTNNREQVRWCLNETNEIKKCIQQLLENKEPLHTDLEKLSREYGTSTLINILESLSRS